MTNHVHLLITPEESHVSARLMQSIGRRYVQYINRHYKRSGGLWEGRYKSSVVQVESYLLTCMRYIELNPVRAGMVADPGQYRWSSYQANGLDQDKPKLTPHSVYLALGRNCDACSASYCALFRPQLDAEAVSDIREALSLGMPLARPSTATAATNTWCASA